MRSPTRRTVQLLSLLPSFFLLAVFAAPRPAAAQEEGLNGVQVETSGLWTSLVGGAFPFQETGPGGSLGIFHRWPTGVSLGVGAMHAQPEDLTLPVDDVRRHLSQWTAYGEVRYSLTELTPVRPYVGGRVGWTKLDDERDPATTGSGVLFGLTAGAEIRPSDRFAFRLAATGSGLTVADFFEEGEVTNAGTWTAEAGVSIFMGSVRRVSDTDGDGVRDARDDCAGTPSGVSADSRGCAIDADRDGIGDYRDECPGTLAGARVDDTGCASDEDGDGIPAGLDDCPRTPEGVEVDNDGCAMDRDGDGVPDDVDECSGTPSGAPVTDRGCVRDADGDGVHDGVDQCPDTPEGRTVDDEGCPEDEIEAGIERGRLSLSGIHFRFGSAELTDASRSILDQVGRTLADRPDVRVQIQGHTDSIGAAQVNLRISRQRAQAVRQYLLEEYEQIGSERLEAVGLGEREPVASNATESGRTRNRRVEFVVIERQGSGSGG